MLRFAALFLISCIAVSPVRAGGLFGDTIEGLCGNCGLGKELDRLHEELGNPLDAPGRVLRESHVEVLGPALAEAIRHSRNHARAAGTQPIPPAIYDRLAGYFSPDLLDGVEFRIGQGHELSVQANSFRFGDAVAVALIDTIIFATSDDAYYNDILWAHEIAHIAQYRRWGLTDFGKKYVRDWEAVEAEANKVERKYAQWLQSVNDPGPPPIYPQTDPYPTQWAQICVTNFGTCIMGQAVPIGSGC